jgi:pimeloyl-ACP methyl ester carboxylesterase
VKELLPTGVSVALIEYPGYAGDPQRLDEWHFLRSSLAAYDEIESRSKLPLFVMGESLGTGAATYCASMRKPKGLLLSTPYTSMAAVAKHRYPWVPIFKLIRHPIYAEQWAPHVLCPVLILHGTEDKTVPYALGQAQAKNFKTLESFVTVPGAGHANLRGFPGGAFWEACRAFLLKHA